MNPHEKRSITAYNKKAQHYDATSEGKFTENFKTLLIEAANIKAGDTILDVACGNGRLLHMVSERYSINGHGTDISDEMIKQARLRNPSMHFSVSRCEQAPYPDHTFDVITVSAAYHHFPHVDRFAKEAYRVLKKSGTIYIAEVYYPPVMRAICNPFLPLLGAGDVKFYSPDAIMTTLGSAGFINQTCIINEHIQIVSACK